MRLFQNSLPGRASFLELLAEVLAMLSRALSAAHTYETLRAASDPQLAEQGLLRSDLPRAAYSALIEER